MRTKVRSEAFVLVLCKAVVQLHEAFPSQLTVASPEWIRQGILPQDRVAHAARARFLEQRQQLVQMLQFADGTRVDACSSRPTAAVGCYVVRKSVCWALEVVGDSNVD
jgi:hypothetical protein